jgi:hypothetical protein
MKKPIDYMSKDGALKLVAKLEKWHIDHQKPVPKYELFPVKGPYKQGSGAHWGIKSDQVMAVPKCL